MNYKKISMVLLITWTIMLVLILSFGTKIASIISSSVSQEIYEEKTKLKDVTLEKTDFLIESDNYLQVLTVPDTHDLSDLVYTSLTPDVFEVDENKVIGKRLESDANIGILLITSLSNPSFKKEVELTFNKSYPEKYQVSLNGNIEIDQMSNAVFLQKQFAISCKIYPNRKLVTEKDIKYVYDENLFDLVSCEDEEIHLIPKYLDFKIGDSFESVSTKILVYLNGDLIDEIAVSVNSTKYLEQFDTAYFTNYQSQEILMGEDVFVNDEYYVNLANDEIDSATLFDVTSSNEEIAEVSPSGKIKFKKTGSVNILVKLQNGFSKSYNIKVRNKIIEPYIACNNLDENNNINIKLETKTSIVLVFPDDASVTDFTYMVDESILIPEYCTNNQLTLIGSKLGTYDLVIRITDGIEDAIVLNFKVNILKNENSFSTIIAQFSRFLAKVLGHMSFFVLQGILAFFMICYHKSGEKWLNIALFVLIGTFTAWLTEFIQLFMKGRNCSIQDIFIDLGGYFIGLMIAVGIRQIIKLYKRKSKKVKSWKGY